MSALTELVKAISHLPPEPLTETQWHALNRVQNPKPNSLSDVDSNLPELDAAHPRVRLIAILASLKGISTSEAEPEVAQKLGDYAAALIAPCSRAETANNPDADRAEDYEALAPRVRDLAVYGLEILRICSDGHDASFSHDTILTLISFTANTPVEPSSASLPPWTTESHYAPQADPWVTTEAGELASGVLAKQLPQRPVGDELLTTILRDYLRPLFSKSRPSAVTASGRKAEFRDEHDVTRALRHDTGEVKPWKFLDHRAMAVFRWVVQEASETFISKQWPMFIPVLLTLLDDGATRVRCTGLLILSTFLGKFPDKILHKTGLASVFEDAVFPTLHFLPSITPEVESVQLLAPAYSSLLLLSRKLDVEAKSKPNAGRTPRARLLDRMLRDGIFSGYSHAKQHARVSRLLFHVTADLVKEMGISAVKHLKDLIPMHCEILTDPFAVAAPELLDVVTLSLVAVLANCWPRLDQQYYQDELIKALVVCFVNVHDDLESNEKLRRTHGNLIVLAEMLSLAGGKPGRSCFDNKVHPLVAKEPVLKCLFKDSL